MKYIKIVNWEKTQHYKYRNNPWIRLYTDITDEFDKNGQQKKFFKLSDAAKLNFLMILCLANQYNNNIPFKNETWLKRKLGIKKLKLQELIQANYILINKNDSIPDSIPDSKDGPIPFSTVTVTDTVTDTEVGKGFALPDQETINEASIPKIEELINQVSNELYYKKIFIDAPKFKNTMLKKVKNPRAVLHALIRCYIKKPLSGTAWGYCEKIMQVEDGNYNEQDYRKSA